jgi:diaminopimelate epimerase
MILPFTKMHGLGNDFVLINALESSIELQTEQLRFIADRRFGIGCDQILLIEATELAGADIRYRIFNADGGEVEQCGNGVRCVGDYLRRRSLINRDFVKVETNAGLVTIYFEDNELIRVDMGVPQFEPESIPFNSAARQSQYSLSLNDMEIELMAVSMGNPHAVIEVDNVNLAEVSKIAPQIQAHVSFPESVNVGFMEIVDREHIRLRVYERGVGETLACGTGACAAVVVGINAGRLESRVDVELTGGHLTINWAGDTEAVWMLGPATTVFEGQIEL